VTSDPLTAVGALGGFFALPRRTTQTLSLRMIVDDDAALDTLIASAAAALRWSGDGPAGRRVAASTALFGLSARIASPLLACTAVHRMVPTLPLDTLYLRPGSLELARGRVEVTELGPDDDVAEALRHALIVSICAALVDAFAAAGRVAAHLLWGNVASSLVSAARLLERRSGTRALPIVRRALAGGPTAGSLRWSSPSGRPTATRTSCCLYYLAAPGQLCGDCVLRRPSSAASR
jgi:hypothetical protein